MCHVCFEKITMALVQSEWKRITVDVDMQVTAVSRGQGARSLDWGGGSQDENN